MERRSRSETLFCSLTERPSQTGDPIIAGAKVIGEVVEQFKDKKVIAFKYKRRKGYHRTVGHRRRLTRVKIEAIS